MLIRRRCKSSALVAVILIFLCGVWHKKANDSSLKERKKNTAEGEPCSSLEVHNEFKLCYSGEAAVARTGFESLYRQMLGVAEYTWMLNRIKRMEPLWLAATQKQFPPPEPFRLKKRIHVHPGLLAWGLAKHAGNGAPVGELVQWSDILATLHMLGHDIVLSKNMHEAQKLYQDYLGTDGCLNGTISFDLIYVDIIGYKEVIVKLFAGDIVPEAVKCKIRVVDTWGTEADFNIPEYAAKKGRTLSFYGGLEMNLKQFNTLYPHSSDNTFLGFVVEKVDSSEEVNPQKRDIALLYAKTHDLLDDKYHYIDIIREYFPEVHATISGRWKKKPDYVTNHNVLSQADFSKLLRRTKIFVGFGRPYEGPGALEAIQLGAIFLNRKINLSMAEWKNPTARVLTSQNTYAQKIGAPHVYTLDIDNDSEVRKVLEKVVNSSDPGGYLAFEFSASGMLQRASVLIEKQQFCVPERSEWNFRDPENKCFETWPPLSSMKMTLLSSSEESCSEACEKKGYICEPSFFPVLNQKGAFTRDDGIALCKSETPSKGELEFPAYDASNNICYLQSNKLLFSCAGNYLKYRRLCPCRDFIPQQIALCGDCIL